MSFLLQYYPTAHLLLISSATWESYRLSLIPNLPGNTVVCSVQGWRLSALCARILPTSVLCCGFAHFVRENATSSTSSKMSTWHRVTKWPCRFPDQPVHMARRRLQCLARM